MNEPAFPRPLSKIGEEEVSSDQGGMTLRDYFAAKAMQGMLSKEGGSTFERYSGCSVAYRIAESMLKSRPAPKQ